MLGSLVPWRQRSLFPTPDRFSNLVNRMEGEMEDLFDRFWLTEQGPLARPFLPPVDLVETENQFEVTVDLPGLKPEEVEVELKNGDLWIAGKREEEKEDKGKTYHRIERRHGEFRRVLPLPATINAEAIEARFDKGVLKIIVPKTEEAQAKHIEVKT